MQRVFAIMDRLENWGILVCFASSLVALSVSVATRYVFKRPLTWPDELTTYLFMLMTFLGASAAVKKNLELKVNVLCEVFPRLTFGMDILLHVMRIAVAFTFIYAGYNFVLIEIEMETVTPILMIPNSIVASMLPLFGLFLSLRSVEALLKLRAERRQKGA